MPVETQPLAACIQGIDIGEVRKVLDGQIAFNKVFVLERAAECIIPYLIETAIPRNSIMSSSFYKQISNSSTTKLLGLFNSLHISNEVQIRLIYYLKNLKEVTENKSGDWVDAFNKMIISDRGAQALDILIDASFDISRLSKGNIDNLAEICTNLAGSTEAITKLTNLFKGTKDFQRMIQHLHKTASSPEQYIKCMNDIGIKFNGTITLGGKKLSITQFMDETDFTGTLFEYYHKEMAGKHYLLKYESKTKQGVLLVIDNASKLLIDADTRLLVNFTKSQVEEIFGNTGGE